MFEHVAIRVSDRAASDRFFTTVLDAVGLARVEDSTGVGWGDFAIVAADAGHSVTRNLHVAFKATDRAAVDAFHRVGVDAGYRSDGEPGERREYREDYYGAFLLDPDANSVEAVHHGRASRPGSIDHLWLRTEDLEAMASFYERIGSRAGFSLGEHRADLRVFASPTGVLALASDGRPVTRHVHLAFSAAVGAAERDPDGHAVDLVSGGAGPRAAGSS